MALQWHGRLPRASVLLLLLAAFSTPLAALPVQQPACTAGGEGCAAPSRGFALLQTRQQHQRMDFAEGEPVALQSGGAVVLTVRRTNHTITAQSDGDVHARWSNRGVWETFTIEKASGSGELQSGDSVFLTAWTGKRITVQNRSVHAKWDQKGEWQKLVIEKKEGSGPILAGDTIFLKAWTGARIDADAGDKEGADDVLARWDDRGSWQELIIDKARFPAHVEDLAWQNFQLINQLRYDGFTCPQGTVFAANHNALKFDCRLWRAALLHSRDMVDNGYFSHTSLDGRTPWDRARAQNTSANGENIAAGRGTAQGTIDQFKGSDGHCRNMLNSGFKVAAVAYAPGGYYGHYWTQMFSLSDMPYPVELPALDTSCYPLGASAYPSGAALLDAAPPEVEEPEGPPLPPPATCGDAGAGGCDPSEAG